VSHGEGAPYAVGQGVTLLPRLLNAEIEFQADREHRMVKEMKDGGPYIKRGPRRGGRMRGAPLSSWVTRLISTSTRLSQLIGAEHELYVRVEELGASPWELAFGVHHAPLPRQ